MAEGKITLDFKHPNEKRYPNQRIMVIDIDGYPYCVPYLKTDNEIVLKQCFLTEDLKSSLEAGSMNKGRELKYLDHEEKEIVESLKDINANTLRNDTKHMKQLEKAAKDYIAKQDKTITLRISSEDLDRIKKIAAKRGLRYQTFIKSIIHQYIAECE